MRKYEVLRRVLAVYFMTYSRADEKDGGKGKPEIQVPTRLPFGGENNGEIKVQE